jgi:polyphosphate kinase
LTRIKPQSEASQRHRVLAYDVRRSQSAHGLGHNIPGGATAMKSDKEPREKNVLHEREKVCIVFEGRDGAGKGGTIKAITERVSPRIFRVVALPAPTEREKSQMYIQRYLPYLPAGGEVVIFDRSWYNRAGVERVMGFCTEDQAKRFLNAVPAVEKSIIESGVHLLKYWLEVSP